LPNFAQFLPLLSKFIHIYLQDYDIGPQVANEVKAKVQKKMTAVCGDTLYCDVTELEAICQVSIRSISFGDGIFSNQNPNLG
jgi:hypothetical protein